MSVWAWINIFTFPHSTSTSQGRWEIELCEHSINPQRVGGVRWVHKTPSIDNIECRRKEEFRVNIWRWFKCANNSASDDGNLCNFVGFNWLNWKLYRSKKNPSIPQSWNKIWEIIQKFSIGKFPQEFMKAKLFDCWSFNFQLKTRFKSKTCVFVNTHFIISFASSFGVVCWLRRFWNLQINFPGIVGKKGKIVRNNMKCECCSLPNDFSHCLN